MIDRLHCIEMNSTSMQYIVHFTAVKMTISDISPYFYSKH